MQLDRLWTPWRRDFIESATAAGGVAEEACFLCAKAADPPARDPDNLVLVRERDAYALLNLYPYNSGHVLVAPYLHTGDLATLDPTIAAALMALTQRVVLALQRAYQPEAFNVGMNLGRPAGAGVPNHLHAHVVPRWNGDTNFMPVVGGAKVLPETLDQTYQRLAPLLAATA